MHVGASECLCVRRRRLDGSLLTWFPLLLLGCQAAPEDARLLCSLGDLTADDACYERAWTASRGRSVRAKRALARSAQRRKDFAAVRPALPPGLIVLLLCTIMAADPSLYEHLGREHLCACERLYE